VIISVDTPPEAFYQTTGGERVTVTNLADVRGQPWLPESLREATDPSHFCLYTIGHTALDQAGERTYAQLLEEEASLPLVKGALYGLPEIMKSLREGSLLTRRATTDNLLDPDNRTLTANDFITQCNRLTYLPPSQMNRQISQRHPMYEAWRSAVPYNPKRPVAKQKPLTFTDVRAVVHAHDVDLSPELLQERFDHYVDLCNFDRGTFLARALGLYRAMYFKSEHDVQPVRNLTNAMAAEYADTLFTDKFFEGQSVLLDLEDRLYTAANKSIASPVREFFAREASQTSEEYSAIWNSIMGFKSVFDTINKGEYPPLLGEMIEIADRARVQRATSTSRRKRPSSPEPVTTEPPHDQPEPRKAVDPIVEAALLSEVTTLSGRIDKLDAAWTMTHKELKKAGILPLAKQLGQGIYQRGRQLLEPLARERAEGVVSLVYRLCGRIAEDGLEHTVNALVEAVNEQAAIAAAARGYRTRTMAAGIEPSPLGNREIPDLETFLGILNNEVQWSGIQVAIREHESSNATINTVNQLLTAYKERRVATEATEE
jgi:hypothetical protein